MNDYYYFIMGLDAFFGDPKVDTDALKSKIRQRRAQMLVHSCIYYELNDNIISDDTWQRWADELEKLQKENPDLLQIGFYDDAFADWDGSTGTHLPLRDAWVYSKAQWLLSLRKI